MLKLNKIYQGDCLDVMQDIDSDSIDCIVTDPPYGLSFMGKDWDKAVPSIEIWQECLRVLKPGAFAFVMCIPRQDCLARMICRLEDAGFNVAFSSVLHTFAQGFPKAASLSKQADKRAGVKREVIAIDKVAAAKGNKNKFNQCTAITPGNIGVNTQEFSAHRGEITEAVTEQAKALDGAYSLNLKPAVEIVIVAMKPIEEKTYLDQALKNGHGCTWLDNCRIPYENEGDFKENWRMDKSGSKSFFNNEDKRVIAQLNNKGRFPANVLCEDNVLDDGIERTSNIRRVPNNDIDTKDPKQYGVYGAYTPKQYTSGHSDEGSFSRYFSLDAWFAERIKLLPKEAQKTFPFMIIPKASKSEKNRGLNKSLLTCECFIIYEEKWKEKDITREEKLAVLQVDTGTLHLKDIEEYGTQINIDPEWNTLLFGKNITKVFQEGIASTIKMGIHSITISQILNWLTSSLTREYTQGVKRLTVNGGSHAENVENCNTLIITTNAKMVSHLIVKDVVSNLRFKISVKEEKKSNIHCSVKPLKLMSWLITLASREDDIVLDPFFGSGTTAIAAKMLSRQYIGIEREEEYCKIARKRLSIIPQRLDSYNIAE